MDKRQKKHLYIAVALGATAFVASSLSFLRVPSKNATNAEWMKTIADGESLTHISIPGTHDSGATLSLFDSAGKCQDASITEQLNFGARFLDIRLKAVGDELHLYHGAVDQEKTFASVLDASYSFLDAHPSETILMSVQEEQNPSGSTKAFETLLSEAIAPKKDNYWLTANAIPTLGEARGKIVLFSRYKAPTLGIDCRADTWAVNQTFDMNNGVKFHIQDTYKLSDNATKWSEATTCFDYANSLNGATTFVINFMSGYLDKKVLGVSLPVAAPTAKYINPLALKNIPSYSFKGIVLFDFFTAELGSAVIGGNV